MLVHQNAQGLKIAVVDNDESARSGLRAQLQALGHEAVPFESGEAFLAAASPEAFDCILLDLWFGSAMTGLEFLRHFPRPGGIGTPVVVITGEPEYETAFDAATLGVKAYLPKPVRRSRLLEALRKALEGAPARPRLARLGEANALAQEEWEALLRAAENTLEPALWRQLRELTPTEAKVFRLLASEGLSNKEAAKRLEKTEHVIEAHRAGVIKKLGTGNLIKLHGILNALLHAAGWPAGIAKLFQVQLPRPAG